MHGLPSNGIGATIRIGREMLCLPYAGLFYVLQKTFFHYICPAPGYKLILHNIDTLSGSLCVCKGRFSARAANPLQQIAYSLQTCLERGRRV